MWPVSRGAHTARAQVLADGQHVGTDEEHFYVVGVGEEDAVRLPSALRPSEYLEYPRRCAFRPPSRPSEYLEYPRRCAIPSALPAQ